MVNAEKPKDDWWKESVIYQIYPRSFQDSNGDGIGDLQGIISRIPYLKDLGIDAIWINPIYESPNCDGGYDISDYCRIHSDFGTMYDFDELINSLHQNNIRLIMDLVMNHSSDEHIWFKESRKSKDSAYRDYYFWRTGEGKNPPNNWKSFFGGSAWQLDENTQEYYLHLFATKQPDLNWDNPTVRQEMKSIVEFWIKKGVDGFRLDVISAISKRLDFPNTDTEDFNETIRRFYSNGPRLNEYIKELRHDLFDTCQVMTVGEGPGITPQNALKYLDERDGLDMIFHFGHMFLDQGSGGRFDPVRWTLKDFKAIFKMWDDTFAKQGWNSVFLGNHDFARMVSRWGNDQEYWKESSKLLLTLLLTMRGTPFVFMGDEIGMTNTQLSSISDSRDVETINGWKDAQASGISEQEFLNRANYAGRDNARTPMQWNAGHQAGFTARTSWMPANENFIRINVASQTQDVDSVLSFFKKLIALRKQATELVRGTLQIVETTVDELFVYKRVYEKSEYLIVLNFSNSVQKHPKPIDGYLLGNYPRPDALHLRPWECLICYSQG